jgi:hypothetical protein
MLHPLIAKRPPSASTISVIGTVRASTVNLSPPDTAHGHETAVLRRLGVKRRRDID